MQKRKFATIRTFACQSCGQGDGGAGLNKCNLRFVNVSLSCHLHHHQHQQHDHHHCVHSFISIRCCCWPFSKWQQTPAASCQANTEYEIYGYNKLRCIQRACPTRGIPCLVCKLQLQIAMMRKFGFYLL